VQLVADAKVEKKDLAVAARDRDILERQLSAKRLQYDRLMAALAAQSGGSHPPGPNGMVFPVRGVHYYSNTWGAPRSGGRHHMGTDVMSPKGTPVVAVTNGVAYPHSSGLGGKSITLTGDNGWQYYYAHLNGYAIHGRVRVKAGQVIGYVGNTGNARGGANHLHFQMGPHGRWVNPYSYLRGME
jgi:murein DD-endopeptidase MepM/ murein hydrolase activator NlpD